MNHPSVIFDTRQRARDDKRLAVLTAAAELFLTRGYHRTRMNDIADILKITKPALYNYFKSKQDILYDCHMLGHDLIDLSLENIEKSAESGLDRLKALIRAYAEIMTQKFGICLILLDEHELSPKQLEVVTNRRREVNARIEAYLRHGLKDGSIGLCDIKLTAFAIAGSLNWISHWYTEGKSLSSGEIGDYFAEYLTRGLTGSAMDRSPGPGKATAKAKK